MQTVADRNVDEPVLAANRHRRFRAVMRQGKEARSAASAEDDRQHVVHRPPLYAAAIRRANLRALSANDMKSSRAGGMMSRLASWRRTVVGGQGRPGRTDVPSRQAPGSAPITA